MKAQHVKVLLADDHDVLRTGLRAILQEHEGWQVCAEAATGVEAIRFAAELQPDVIVLDLEMEGLDGLAVTRQIKERHPEIEVVIFTMHDDEYLMNELLSAGARAFVLKSESGQTLLAAIESAIAHKFFFSERASETLLNSVRKSPADTDDYSILTDREKEVVRLLASGRSNKEAASLLGISTKTVETHRASIMRKLRLSSIASLVRYAVRERLIRA